MPASFGVSLFLFVVLSLVMVLAMVPFSLSLIQPPQKIRDHRPGLRKLGGPAKLTEILLPSLFDDWPARHFWSLAYGLTWLGLAAMIVTLISATGQELAARNYLIALGVVAGWWVVHAALILFARAIVQAQPKTSEAIDDDPELTSDPEPAEPTPELTRSEPEPRESWGRKALNVVRALVLVFILAVVSQIPILQRFDAAVESNKSHLLWITIPITTLGFIGLMSGAIHMALRGGRPMTLAQIEQMRARNPAGRGGVFWRASTAKVQGLAAGSAGSESFHLRELIGAWRAKLWRYDPVWRRRFLMAFGAFAMAVGIFGLVFSLGPAPIRLLAATALGYAAVRTSIALWRA